MPFEYLAPSTFSELRQGEIVSDVYELRPLHSPVEIPVELNIPLQTVYHPRLIVMTADCDLLQDYNARKNAAEAQQSANATWELPNVLPHILLCELYEQDEIREWITGSDIWRRIRQNQDERYHHLPAAPVGNLQGSELPDLYLDFKRILTLPTHLLYEALESSQAGRIAVLPPVYIQNLMHRFYSFLSRVAIPD